MSEIPSRCGKWRVLLIGNDAYQYLSALSASENDVLLIKEVLEQTCNLDHAPVCKFNLNLEELSFILEQFVLTQAPQGSNTLIFYAGHGFETGDGTFAVPVDADPDLAQSVKLETSFNHLLRRFQCQNAQGTLFLILGCCREAVCATPMVIPLKWMSRPQKSLGDVVLHACRQSETIIDSVEASAWIGGRVRKNSRFAVDCARGIVLARRFQWNLEDMSNEICHMAEERLCSGKKASPAISSSFRPPSARNRTFLTSTDALAIRRISKSDALGGVADTAIKPTIAECANLWESVCDLDVHPSVRHLELSYWALFLNPGSKKEVALAAIGICENLLDQGLARRCCLGPRMKPESPHPAAMVLAHARLVHYAGSLAKDEVQNNNFKMMAGRHAAICWQLLSSTSFDSYVLAQVICCLAYHCSREDAGAEREKVRGSEAWHMMHYAAVLNQCAGLTQLSISNHISACKMRMDAGGKHAVEVCRQLRDIAVQHRFGMSDKLLLKHKALMMLNNHRQGRPFLESQAFVRENLAACPPYYQETIRDWLSNENLELL